MPLVTHPTEAGCEPHGSDSLLSFAGGTRRPARTQIVRPALSRLELVIALLIFLSSVGLLVVYLARQRGRAERVHCMKNLMLIGQGVKSFHDAQKELRGQGFLPPARITDGYATWAVLLVPHVAPENRLKD